MLVFRVSGTLSGSRNVNMDSRGYRGGAGGAYEVTGSSVKKYYSIAGMTAAMHEGTGLQYLLTDHLGSVVAITSASGTLTSQQRYLPFGGARTDVGSITQTDFGYTGQRLLDSGMGGIMDYREAPRSEAERARRGFIRLILPSSPNLTLLYQTHKTLKPGTVTHTFSTTPFVILIHLDTRYA